MRKKEKTDHDLFDLQYESFVWAVNPKNPLMAELAAIDKLLDEAPEVLDGVHEDLCKGTQTGHGRPPEASSEQLLRSAILMQLRGAALSRAGRPDRRQRPQLHPKRQRSRQRQLYVQRQRRGRG